MNYLTNEWYTYGKWTKWFNNVCICTYICTVCAYVCLYVLASAALPRDPVDFVDHWILLPGDTLAIIMFLPLCLQCFHTRWSTLAFFDNYYVGFRITVGQSLVVSNSNEVWSNVNANIVFVSTCVIILPPVSGQTCLYGLEFMQMLRPSDSLFTYCIVFVWTF